MALRFQKQDEVDLAKVEGFGSAWLSPVMIFGGIAFGVWRWLSSGYSAALENALLWVIAGLIARLAFRVVSADIDGIDSRSKEIDGKVSVIESTVSETREHHIELLERFTAIEEKMDAMQRELESRIKSTR